MQKGDQFKRKAPIARRTPKRDKDERYYNVQAREFFDVAVKNGTNTCIFCGEKVKTFQGLHHWRGRTGDYLLDKRWWSIVHNEHHVDCFHMMRYEVLSTQPWFESFLTRLKLFDPTLELYNKVIKRGEKSHKLNPTFEFDEDF
jgi:hypothetical protein